MQHIMDHNGTVTEVEYRSDVKLIKDTPYLTLMGEIWEFYFEWYGVQPHDNGTELTEYLTTI